MNRNESKEKDPKLLETTQLIHHIWQGKNEAIGLYDSDELSIAEGADKIADRMIKLIPRISKSSRMLVLGSGFGGTAQYIMEKFECKMDCIDDRPLRSAYLHKIINTLDDKLQKKITLTEGVFTHLPYDLDTFDIVWAQDVLYKSVDKVRIFKEIHRVLKPGARVVFTELNQSDACQESVLSKLKEIMPHISLVTKTGYLKVTRKTGLQKVYYLGLTEQVAIHYRKVIELLQEKKDKVIAKTAPEVMEGIINEAQVWIDLAEQECIEWGIMIYQKINR